MDLLDPASEFMTVQRIADQAGGSFASDEVGKFVVENAASLVVNNLNGAGSLMIAMGRAMIDQFGVLAACNYALQFGWRVGKSRAIAIPDGMLAVRRLHDDPSTPLASKELGEGAVLWTMGAGKLRVHQLTVKQIEDPSSPAVIDLLMPIAVNLLTPALYGDVVGLIVMQRQDGASMVTT